MMNTLFGYVVKLSDDYLCYKLYETKLYSWSPILFTLLCGVMGLHMNIELVGWGWDHW